MVAQTEQVEMSVLGAGLGVVAQPEQIEMSVLGVRSIYPVVYTVGCLLSDGLLTLM